MRQVLKAPKRVIKRVKKLFYSDVFVDLEGISRYFWIKTEVYNFYSKIVFFTSRKKNRNFAIKA